MQIGVNSVYRPDRLFKTDFTSIPELAVCIPVYNETSVLTTLDSLANNKYTANVAVIFVINAPENSAEAVYLTNTTAYDELVWYCENNALFFYTEILEFTKLPQKIAGVGLARKISMERALDLPGIDDNTLILTCLDADCSVSENYFEEVKAYFKMHRKISGASIYFEHPYPENGILISGIIEYELHLRYLKQSLQWSGFPYYFHTVGSAMAVRAGIYKKTGGMNTRKAGEDFYFLQKIMPHGFGEINSTSVFPQARISDRVPFGTGRSMLNYMEKPCILTYHFGIFEIFKTLFTAIRGNETVDWEKLQTALKKPVWEIFTEEGIEEAWNMALANSSNAESARKRFLTWFSGFRYIRIMHSLRTIGYPDLPVVGAIEIPHPQTVGWTAEAKLELLRSIDKTGY